MIFIWFVDDGENQLQYLTFQSIISLKLGLRNKIKDYFLIVSLRIKRILTLILIENEVEYSQLFVSFLLSILYQHSCLDFHILL